LRLATPTSVSVLAPAPNVMAPAASTVPVTVEPAPVLTAPAELIRLPVHVLSAPRLMAPTEVKSPIIVELAPVAVAPPISQDTFSDVPALPSAKTTLAPAATERAPPHLKVHSGAASSPASRVSWQDRTQAAAEV
jgi:hypothetical protein